MRRGSVLGAFVDGWRRVWRAPVIVVGLIVATYAVSSIALPSYARGTGFSSNGPWSYFFGQLAMDSVSAVRGNFSLFSSIPGSAGWLIDARPTGWHQLLAAAVRVTFWIFLCGGVLDRLARARVTRGPAFFSACGVHVFRFLRLALIFWPLYWLALRFLPDSSWRLLIVLGVIALGEDFARARIVVEDRRSAIGAVIASVRFIGRRPGRAAMLFLLNAAITAGLLSGLSSVLSHNSDVLNGPLRWLVSLVFVSTRLLVSLAFAASELAFFQSELAHAEYTAAPPFIWPESPAVEAIANMARTKL